MAESSMAVSTDVTVADKPQLSFAYCALHYKPRRACRPFVTECLAQASNGVAHVMIDSQVQVYLYAGYFTDNDFAAAVSGAGRKGAAISFPEHTEVSAYFWMGKVAHIRLFYEVSA